MSSEKAVEKGKTIDIPISSWRLMTTAKPEMALKARS
jgi:hypothetical protein